MSNHGNNGYVSYDEDSDNSWKEKYEDLHKQYMILSENFSTTVSKLSGGAKVEAPKVVNACSKKNKKKESTSDVFMSMIEDIFERAKEVEKNSRLSKAEKLVAMNTLRTAMVKAGMEYMETVKSSPSVSDSAIHRF